MQAVGVLGSLVLEAAIRQGSKAVLEAVEVDVKLVGAMKAAASNSLGTVVLAAAIRKDSKIVLEEVERVFEFKEGVPHVGAIEAAVKALGPNVLEAAYQKGSAIVAKAMAAPGIKLDNKVSKAVQDRAVLQADAHKALQALVTEYTGDSAAADTEAHVDGLLAESNTQKDLALIADIEAWLSHQVKAHGGKTNAAAWVTGWKKLGKLIGVTYSNNGPLMQYQLNRGDCTVTTKEYCIRRLRRVLTEVEWGADVRIAP
jgi:hypothetical protein